MKKTNEQELLIELTDYQKEIKTAKELISKVSEQYKFYRDIAKKKATLPYKTIVEAELGCEIKDKDILLKEDEIIEHIIMPHTKRKSLVAMTDQILGAVADLSLVVDNEIVDLENKYEKQYLQSPALGRVLYLEHQETIFAPYDKMKNKCFDFLMKLDPDATIIDEIE